MLRQLYDRTLLLAASPRAPLWLAVVSFAESSFFPVPPDPLLLLMGLARPERAFRFALICTVASVAGGALGYLIGYALYEQVALPIFAAYGYEKYLTQYQAWYQQWGLWLILAKGLLPIPYKVVTILSGAAGFDFPMFLAASLLTRGARFFLVAALLRRYGAPIRDFIERRLGLVTAATAVGVVVGFAMLRLL